MPAGQPHFAKFAPIDREHPLFELEVEGTVLFDIGANDEGEVEVMFHQGAVGKSLGWAELLQYLDEGHRLVQEDLASDTPSSNEI